MRQVIIHIDGDAFFASCEAAQNENLRGKPIVVGEERGIATAVSYEAKAQGVSRGLLMGDIRKICPGVIIVPSHYDVYKVYSRRMYDIVRRFSSDIEEYSVDECFARLESSHDDFLETAKKIKNDLTGHLGMTFSVGIAPTKTLAKVASKRMKPNGLTIITHDTIKEFLHDVPIGAVWGIGPNTSAALSKLGIKTALDFILKTEDWVEEHVSKPYHEIWLELRGVPIHAIHSHSVHEYKSIMRTRTFRPPSRDKFLVFSELCKNIEYALARLRRYGLVAGTAHIFLKTKQFMYHRTEIGFAGRTAVPADIMEAMHKAFNGIFKENTEYRSTGVTFSNLAPQEICQADIFGESSKRLRSRTLFETVDALTSRYGKDAIFLASSLKAHAPSIRRAKRSTDSDIFHQTGIPCWNAGGQTK